MAEPTPTDPLGVRPDPTSISEMLEAVVDARIEFRLRGHSSEKFRGTTDQALAMELIARGWAVFKPTVNQ